MGNKPVESMDREKAFIPTLQIQFLDHIVIPVYRLVDKFSLFRTSTFLTKVQTHI